MARLRVGEVLVNAVAVVIRLAQPDTAASKSKSQNSEPIALKII